MLHYTEARLQLDAVERTRERPERLPVGVADQQLVLLLAPLRLRAEAEGAAVGEADRLEAVEHDRGGLADRLALDPDRALARGVGIVDAGDEVPADGAAVGRGADARGPAPLGVAGVVAGGLVLDPAHRPLHPPATRKLHVDLDLGDALARPDEPAGLAVLGGADALLPLAAAVNDLR